MSGAARWLVAVVVGLAWGLVAAGAAGAAEGQAPSQLPTPQVYGLYSWGENYAKYAGDVEKVGIKWVRVGGWDNGKGADVAALAAAKHGTYLTPTLFLRGMSHSNTMPVDEAVKAFRDDCRKAVDRYGPKGTLWKEHAGEPSLPIRHWEIWNEPNIEFLNPPDGMMRTELYAQLLKVASEEIRKADPGACIVAFNTAGGVPYQGHGVPPDGMFQKLKYIGWRKFIREVNAITGPNVYDAIGVHPYTMPKGPEVGGVPKGVEMIHELEKEQSFKKPIWFTEVGYPIEYPRNLQVRDEAQQAAFTARLYAVAGARGVMTVQIMYIEDIVYSPDNTRRSFGFFTAPGKWRQQATATQTMAKLIADPRKVLKNLDEQDGGVWAYEFEGPRGLPVIMAWNTGEGTVERQFAVKAGTRMATLIDMLGKTSELEVADGKVKVILGEAPVYLVPAGKEALGDRK